jgi:hypothetical protein
LYEVRVPGRGDDGPILGRQAGGRAAVPGGAEPMKFNCQRCGAIPDGVVEEHTDAPQGHVLPSSGAGIPCPICNTGDRPYPADLRRHISGEYIDE